MVEVSAPASSGNLGPGFDVLGLALELRCRVSAELSDVWGAEHLGPEIPNAGAEDIILTAARTISPDQPLSLTVNNEIPLGRGLGSSSAAAAAGAAAAMVATTGSLHRNTVRELVAEFEGHADNAAATVYGGLVGVGNGDKWIRLGIHQDWRVVVAIPAYDLLTSHARKVLPPEIPRPAVVRNLGRLLGLTEGLRTGESELMDLAGGDELHESCRSGLHPEAVAIMSSAIKGGAAHACWSGAGPSVLAFAKQSDVERVIDALETSAGVDAEVRTLDIAYSGLEILSGGSEGK